MYARIVTWDWREQPDMDVIAALVSNASRGVVVMRELNTGTDQHAWVIADHPVTEEEAWDLYRS